MELDIVGVFRSTNESEYLELMVTSEEANLKDYAVTDSTFDENGDHSNKQRHFFKFPQQKVIKDQKIYLFTNPQNWSQGASDNSGNLYYSWNLNHEVWNNNGDTAVIIKIEKIKSKKVN